MRGSPALAPRIIAPTLLPVSGEQAGIYFYPKAREVLLAQALT